MAKKHLFKKHRKERGKYGVSAYDTYDLTGYLTRSISNALRELAYQNRGCPGSFYDENYKGPGTPSEAGQKKWTATLNEIADGLEAGLDWFDNLDVDGKDSPRYKAYKRAMRKLSKHWFNLWY